MDCVNLPLWQRVYTNCTGRNSRTIFRKRKRILGQKNGKTIEIYLHSVSDDEIKAMNKPEETYFRSSNDTIDIAKLVNKQPPYWQKRSKGPPYEVLVREIEDLGYVGVGKKYGVSDNAVRKWKNQYEKAMIGNEAV